MVQKTRQVWQAVVSTKQGVIWIIFGKQHQHSQFQKWHAYSTFFIPSLLLIYLILNSCDGKCAKQRVSSVDYEKSWLCSVLALKRAGFSLADVQSDVILPSRMNITAFSTDQQRRRFVICFPICHWCPASTRWCRGHVSCTMYTYSCSSRPIL